MNIFELYLDKIKSTIVDLQNKDELIIYTKNLINRKT